MYGCDYAPALLWMLITFVVEVQRDFGIQADSKIIIHHTFLCVEIPGAERETHSYSRERETYSTHLLFKEHSFFTLFDSF